MDVNVSRRVTLSPALSGRSLDARRTRRCGAMADDQWWYNTKTGQVEQESDAPWTDRIGPYASREEAAGAMDRVRENSRRWADEESRDDR
jgi:hypothetical protein